MSCTTVSVSGGSLLYAFDLYEVDFSSLWTLMPDAQDTNFPLITFNNKIDGTIPVFGAQTGATLESIYHPSFTNGMQLIDPDLEDFDVKILTSTPSTLSYLVAGLENVFDTSAEIASQITYGIDLVISASQSPAVELERAWDEAWERGLINPTASVLYSYFTLMGLTYEMDIRRSEGTNLPAFEAWLDEQEVPDDIQANLLSLDSQLTSGGPEYWKTEYNYTNEGFEPYQITSVFFGIQNLKVDPNWSCENPYDLPEPWTKYRSTERPRLDALRAYGRIIIPDKIIKVREGTYSITAADLSGSNIINVDVPYGFNVTTDLITSYGSGFAPSPSTPSVTGNWAIDTIVSSSLWTFDNTHFGVVSAYDDYFTIQIRVPLSLRTQVANDPTLGSQQIDIGWTGEFINRTETIYPSLKSAYFDSLYSSCGQGGGEKVKYIKGVGIIFDVQSFANGDLTLHSNINSCKSDILSIYDNYFEYAANYSKVASYGDIINFHGRFIDSHGAEFFTTTKQVLRPQEYILGDNEDLEIINLNAIVNADEAKACADGQVYNADNLTIPCSSSSDIFQTNQVPVQKSTTSVSLSSKLTKVNGKICPVLPPNITPKT